VTTGRLFVVWHVSYLLLLVAVPCLALRRLQLPVACGFVVSVEQVGVPLVAMKVVSADSS